MKLLKDIIEENSRVEQAETAINNSTEIIKSAIETGAVKLELLFKEGESFSFCRYVAQRLKESADGYSIALREDGNGFYLEIDFTGGRLSENNY